MLALLQPIATLAAGFWGGLKTFVIASIPYLLEKVVGLFGVGVVTYYGFDIAINQLETWVFNNFDNVASDMFSIMVIAGIPDGFKVVFAAAAAVFVISAVQRVILRKGHTAGA